MNSLLSVTNSYTDKLDLSFQDQRCRNFQKGCEMGPFDSIILIQRKKRSFFRGFPMYKKNNILMWVSSRSLRARRSTCVAIIFQTGPSDASLAWCRQRIQCVDRQEPSHAAFSCTSGLAGRRSGGEHHILPLESGSRVASWPFLLLPNFEQVRLQRRPSYRRTWPPCCIYPEKYVIHPSFFVVGLKQSRYGIKSHYSIY